MGPPSPWTAAGVYTTGFFFNTADFDPDLDSTYNLTAPGTYDVFVSKLGPPTGEVLRINHPNGGEGELLATGSPVLIQWQAPSTAVRFDLSYSINNGQTWKPVATGVTGRSYGWTVPAQANNKPKSKVRIVAYNASNAKTGTAMSDAPFTIEVVKLDLPNGGEELTSGNPATISWTTDATLKPVARVKVLYTISGGSAWKRITTLTGNPGSYAWTVPTVSSSQSNCKVRVVLQDAAGKSLGKDDSNTMFTIHP